MAHTAESVPDKGRRRSLCVIYHQEYIQYSSIATEIGEMIIFLQDPKNCPLLVGRFIG